jgi:hypothetical protein
LLRVVLAKSGPAAEALGVGHIADRRFRHATPRLIIDGHIWLAFVVGVGYMVTNRSSETVLFVS